MDGRVKRKSFAELMAEAALQGMPEDKTTTDLLNIPLSRGAILPLTEYLDRAEFDLSSGLPGAVGQALTAPARAAQGQISDQQMIPEAFNVASMVTGGSMGAPRPAGSVGMGGVSDDVMRWLKDSLSPLKSDVIPEAAVLEKFKPQLDEIDSIIAQYAPYADQSPAMARQVEMLWEKRQNLTNQIYDETRRNAGKQTY